MYVIALLLTNLNCFAGNDFTHTLTLAKYSACKDVVKHTQQSNNPRIHQSKLKALSSGPFPWLFEVTNGYQEGFVYYALLGYANELSGDIPFAYRCYQNSLACIDEDKSFSHPLPRAEIYLAIGRTCLAAGRYMDAKDWLDNAFLEAGDNLQLQAAIDRVLIQRANEIGDYPEVIFLYQHLLSLANDNKSPPLLKGDTGGFKNTNGKVELTKPEIANYAQILFYSRKDREGFSKLLEGISKYGIDNNLGVKDPLVDKFLNNIMRADDDEVKYFYDLLGWAIVDARANAGDEEYLAFLCNARTLFCKVYDFLDKEDDLEKVKERIDVVKEQIAAGNPPWSVTRNPLSVKRKKKELKSKKLKIDKSGNTEKTPEIKIDDLLMLADWKLKHKDYKTAGTNYYLASLIATGKFANLEYDGTTMENAAVMGLLMINPKSQIENPKFFDGSYRAAELTLQLYLAATNDEQRAGYDTEAAIAILPIADPAILFFYDRKVRRFNNENMINAIKNYIKRKPEYVSGYKEWCHYLLSEGNSTGAFSVLLKGLSFRSSNNSRHLLKHSRLIFSFASKEDLIKFSNMWPAMEILPILGSDINRHRSFQGIVKARNFINVELEMREAYENGQYEKVIDILNKELRIGGGGHEIKKANAFFALGQTNNAFNAAWKAYESRLFIAEKDDAPFPPEEIVIIKNAITENTPHYRIEQYARWLKVKIEEYKSKNKTTDVNNALAEYNRVIRLIKKEQK